jgi:uncharacterized protein (DUF697 family)
LAFPVRLGVVRGLLKEVSTSAKDDRPLVLGGALADVLARELARGGRAEAVRVGAPDGAALYVRVVGGSPDDEEALKRAHRAKVPIVAVADPNARVPYVLPTDVVPLPPGQGFPVEAIAKAVAAKLGEEGTALAARLPVLRRAVCEQLIESFARKNGIVGAAVFIPGADLPVLALNQLRLVLRIAAAYGEQIDSERLPELLTTLGAGFGFRLVARELLDFVPVAGWAVKGAVAYAGTRALGEAAVRWFDVRHPASHERVTPPPAAVGRAAP